MKALTIHQPWAWAIVVGHKRIENRTWPTSYRGPLAIHAGSSRASIERGTRFIERLGIAVPEDLPTGVIIGTVELVDCVPLREVSDDDFAEGPWCWVLEGARAMRPIAATGRLGLWEFTGPRARRLAIAG